MPIIQPQPNNYNNLTREQLGKGARFCEPLAYDLDPARFCGRTDALLGLLEPDYIGSCPPGMSFHAYLAGKNEERFDLYARPIL